VRILLKDVRSSSDIDMEKRSMKQFVKWCAIIGGSAIAGTLIVRAVRDRIRAQKASSDAETLAETIEVA
jgi:hypothetical protein